MERTLSVGLDAVSRSEVERPERRLGALFDASHERLYRLARRMSADPEEARDLVQQAFLKAARRPDRVPATPAGGEAWMVRAVVNLCRDRSRRRAVRFRAHPLLPAPPSGADPESAAVARATVSAALGRLGARRRAVLILHELEDRSVEEIAADLGIARVTVRWHLARGREELRRFLGGSQAAADRGEDR